MAFLLLIMCLGGCASMQSADGFRDGNMDFGSIRTVEVLPFANLSRDNAAADRVRDVFMTALLSTGAVYVVPVGEVNRGLIRAGISNPAAPSTEEVIKLAGFVKADAVIIGTVKEYGEVRSGSSVGNAVSLSLQMIETQTGRVVWSASTTKGGIGVTDRLFGGGGEPMNAITEKAVDDLVNKLLP
ncbi:GNA1162 family protein [Geotalea sp. SG265]|uniref:GNA1162 family protein n=1 Tax=Geotalea sp. SG265 TaxID=2922867 RepID=UPI001FAEDC3D|nr:GNA1162 family protein [Geotalea sp. SG265]